MVQGLTKEQTLWLSGYFEGRLAVLGGSSEVQQIGATAAAVAPAPQNRINLTILFGTETGHSQGLAERLGEKATFKGINAQVYSLYDYNYRITSYNVCYTKLLRTKICFDHFPGYGCRR